MRDISQAFLDRAFLRFRRHAQELKGFHLAAYQVHDYLGLHVSSLPGSATGEPCPRGPPSWRGRRRTILPGRAPGWQERRPGGRSTAFGKPRDECTPLLFVRCRTTACGTVWTGIGGRGRGATVVSMGALTTGGTGVRLEIQSRVHVCRHQKGRITSFSVSEHIHTIELATRREKSCVVPCNLHINSTRKTIKPRSIRPHRHTMSLLSVCLCVQTKQPQAKLTPPPPQEQRQQHTQPRTSARNVAARHTGQ